MPGPRPVANVSARSATGRTTTTGSSLAAWKQEAARAGLVCATRVIHSYPTAPGFIAALADRVRPVLAEAARDGARARLLLSAHGLPERIVRAGNDVEQGLSCEGELQRFPGALVCPPKASLSFVL